MYDSGGFSYGRTELRPRSPIDQSWPWLREAVWLRPWGKFSLKSLTFGHFLCENGQKAFSFRWLRPTDLPPGALPLGPFGKSWIRRWSSHPLFCCHRKIHFLFTIHNDHMREDHVCFMDTQSSTCTPDRMACDVYHTPDFLRRRRCSLPWCRHYITVAAATDTRDIADNSTISCACLPRLFLEPTHT